MDSEKGQNIPQEELTQPFLFSVIIPIFNSEIYLRDAITSVIEQSIGFQQNIQLILINNASTDKCENICKEYLHLYPNNIVYIPLEKNLGPGGARNIGIPYAKGKYVNFMDSDDKWGRKAFEQVANYIQVDPYTTAIACRIRYFDRKKGFHVLDFRFKGKSKKVISIFNDFEAIQVHTNNVFFKTDIIKKYSYDSKIFHGEDVKLFTEIILKEKKYALLTSAWYYYRKRHDRQSLLDQEQTKEIYFSSIFSNLLSNFVECSEVIFHEVIPYVQELILYTITNRIRDERKIRLSEETQKYCLECVAKYIKYVDDIIIGSSKHLRKEEKIFLLNIKHERDISKQLVLCHNRFLFNNIALFSVGNLNTLKITNMDCFFDQSTKENSIRIYGKVCLPIDADKYQVVAVRNDSGTYKLAYYKLDISSQRKFCGYIYYEERGFRVELPLNNTKSIAFNLLVGNQCVRLKMNFQFVAKLTNDLRTSYCMLNQWILSKNSTQTSILVEDVSGKNFRKHEWNIWKELFFTRRVRTLLWRILILSSNFILKKAKRKIWLFVDYFSQANDNAEAMFQYVIQHLAPRTKAYFVVSKQCADYDRIKKYAKVIPYDTKKYRLMFAVCDKVITSQTFFSKRNTFYERTTALKDLFHFDYVYLQHGIIKDNHANTLAHYKTDLDILITSALPEYNSLLTEEYQLTSDIVKLTGLARYDELAFIEKNPKSKKILLAPTWRKSQLGEWDEAIQGYKYQENFKQSDFFLFFNGLITDPRILHALESCKFEIEIQLHPRLWAQRADFVESEFVKIEYTRKPLIEEIKGVAMLITDYSSVAFDYAYVKVPIIYMQFDKDAFYANHAYVRGYFDFDKDGFGPVCYDYESSVQAVLDAIYNNCNLLDVYEKRIDNFFLYRDGRNCERIYNEILKLDQEVREE